MLCHVMLSYFILYIILYYIILYKTLLTINTQRHWLAVVPLVTRGRCKSFGTRKLN